MSFEDKRNWQLYKAINNEMANTFIKELFWLLVSYKEQNKLEWDQVTFDKVLLTRDGKLRIHLGYKSNL